MAGSLVTHEQTTDRTEATGHRLYQIDAMRGLAALSVVFLHLHDMLLPASSHALPFYQKTLLVLLTPFYAGSEAVTMFFVLSGMVLSLPYLIGREQPYVTYLSRRIVRIYGPYLGALTLALLAASQWHNHPFYGAWLAPTWSRPLDAALILQHVVLIGVFATRQYLFVVWSLVQEMRISIVLPLLVRVTGRLGIAGKVLVGVAMSTAAVLAIQQDAETSARFNLAITVHFAAMFILGIGIASELGRIRRIWQRTPQQWRSVLGLASAALYFLDKYIAKLLLSAVPGSFTTAASRLALANWIAAIGAMGLIVQCLHSPVVKRLLKTGPAGFLGRISYSLYLLHPIVLLVVRFAAGDRVSKWVQAPLYLAGSLIFAWLFYVVVEEPFIHLSRSLKPIRWTFAVPAKSMAR